MNAHSSRTALLHYTTRNLGDDIQTFAVRQFIETDFSLDRDKLRTEATDCDLVLYGWLLQSRQWPPKPPLRIHPLSIHVTPRSRPLVAQHIAWWRRQAPISCRDVSTAEFFLSHGIPAQMDGCVTLSLKRWIDPRPGTAVFVDVAAGTGAAPRVEFAETIIRSHKIADAHRTDQSYRQQTAREALEDYQRAELVVTSRLHALLPCLAFRTPVVYVPNRSQWQAPQYTRMLDYLPYVETWDGKRAYASGGPLPVNHRPTALIHRITERLVTLKNRLG